MIGYYGGVLRLGLKVGQTPGTQFWVPGLGLKVGSKGLVRRLVKRPGHKAGSQGLLQMIGPKVVKFFVNGCSFRVLLQALF